MRGPVMISGLVHLAVVLALLIVRGSNPISISGGDVMQVQLLDASAMKAMTEPAPAPVAPAAKPPEIKPLDEEGIQLEPDKPKTKPAKEPPKEAPRAEAQPVALPYAQLNTPGLSGQVAVDGGDFAFAYYLRQVRSRIAQNWTPPAGLQAGDPIHAVVYFKISRDGSISSIRLETGSPAEFFDRSALRAVTLSDPMPPLPLGFNGSDLGVHFGFRYAQP